MSEEEDGFDFSSLVEEVDDVVSGDAPDDAEGVSEEEEVEEVADTPDVEDAEEDAEDTATEQPQQSDMEKAWDTRLQKLDQLMATFDKKQVQHEANPTAETEKALEKAKSNLAKFQGRPDDDVDPFKDVPEMAKEMETALAERDQRIAEMEERLNQASQSQQTLSSRLAEMDFNDQYPALSGRYKDLTSQARAYADEIVGDATGEAADKIWAKLANDKMDALKTQALASVEKVKKVDTNPSVKPKGVNTVSSKSAANKPAKSKSAEDQMEDLVNMLVERDD